MRRESARGAYVTVVKSGAQQAGAIFVTHNRPDGTFDLYGPAPQSIFVEPSAERLFEKVLTGADQENLETYLEKQKRFDPDLWIIETETGSGDISLDCTIP